MALVQMNVVVHVTKILATERMRLDLTLRDTVENTGFWRNNALLLTATNPTLSIRIGLIVNFYHLAGRATELWSGDNRNSDYN